ncbi:MAG TPA: hypothetical protein PKO06_24635, partial [Candidatus Ozemobacteraceae bacterium]|nr:hypothetical protein [Candidatus Ozemobacteraceae bacterium]
MMRRIFSLFLVFQLLSVGRVTAEPMRTTSDEEYTTETAEEIATPATSLASAPADVIDAIRHVPISTDLLGGFVNTDIDFKDPAFYDKLLMATRTNIVVEDLPHGYVQITKGEFSAADNGIIMPQTLEYALFKGTNQRWVLVGSWENDHPDGYWSEVEAWLWEKGV